LVAHDDKSDPILEEAMDWLLRLNAASQDSALACEFENWLAQSPEHRIAWQKARRTWRVMREVPPVYEHVWRREDPRGITIGSSRRVSSLRSRSHWGRRAVAASIGLAACVVIALNYPALSVRLQADYATGTAETRTVHLIDGTSVELAADSAIKIDMAKGERRVTLLAGEAFFDVTHDAARPFVVAAAGVDVIDLGTAFNVQLSATGTSVELSRGSVSVALPKKATNEMVLVPGEAVVVDRSTGAMQKSTIAHDDIAAWRDGKLFVNDVPIATVIEQLQRYHRAWITIPDRDLGQQKVTGLYDLRHPDRALRALVEPYGGTVRTVAPYVRLITRF
jgi:transmembrane sensor